MAKMEDKTYYKNADAFCVEGCGCVSNAVVYGLCNSIRRAKFPMATDTDNIISAEELSYWINEDYMQGFIDRVDGDDLQEHDAMRLNDAIKAYRNLKRLSLTDKGAGHDQALTGVIVQFDLAFSNKAWVEAERYHFLDFVSSQSTMHRITKFDLDSAYNEYVDPRIIDVMKEKVAAYNELMSAKERDANECAQKYLEILYSNPAGFRITAGMTTNYRQLKTIYAQRKDHRLPEWREFCRWIETLPLSELITGNRAGSEGK